MTEWTQAEVIEWLKTDEGTEWERDNVWPIVPWYHSRNGAFGSILTLRELGSGDHQYRPRTEHVLKICTEIDECMYEPDRIPKGLSSPA